MFFLRLLLIAPSLLLAIAVSIPAFASNDDKLVESLINSPNEFISERVKENYNFHGLASYYNNVSYYIVENDNLHKLDEGEVVELNNSQWLAAVGRLSAMLIKGDGLSVSIKDLTLVINNPDALKQPEVITKVVSKSDLLSIAPELDQIRYAHLWAPFAWLTKLVESALISIQANIVSNWGMTIVVFSVLLKILLLPVGIMTTRFQRVVSRYQAILAPQLDDIKANYDGEEAHNRIMAAHKKSGITPFYALKPMLGSFIQIPILIAVFNALGEMPQLVDQSFLWIENLAYPDVIGHLPFAIPMFGDTTSLLPFIMTAVTLYSTIIFQNRHAHEVEMKRQKRNLYLMAAAFFVLFYPFPAVMVLYWALNNILHTFQQQIIKI